MPSDPPPELPHRARIWNYWLGGKDHYAADRDTADAISTAYPGAPALVLATHRFGRRVVAHLAATHGIRQFVDIGTGLPADRDVQDVLAGTAQDARVVHLDHDPFVLVRARALPMRPGRDGSAVYRDADFRDPAAVLAAAASVLDLRQPVAVLVMGVLGYLRSPELAGQVVRGILDGLVPGSFLAVWEATATSDGVEIGAALRTGPDGGYRLSSGAELADLFAGLDLVEPGVVPVSAWRPDGPAGAGPAVDAYGGLGRLPATGVPVPAPEHTVAPEAAPSGLRDRTVFDHAVGDAVLVAFPAFVDTVVAARGFLARAVGHLAELGVRQFLDIGSGLPGDRTARDVAMVIPPDARVVHVDAVDSLGTAVDPDRPAAALLMGVLGFVDVPGMHRAVRAVAAALPPDSYVVVWEATDTSDGIRAATAAQPYRLSTIAELSGCFAGLNLIEPGLVPITAWRPDPSDGLPLPVDGFGGVARVPDRHSTEGEDLT